MITKMAKKIMPTTTFHFIHKNYNPLGENVYTIEDMKINLQLEAKNVLLKYIEQKYLNINTADMWLSLCYSRNIINEDQILLEAANEEIGTNDAYFNLCLDYWEIDQNDEDVSHLLKPSLIESDSKLYLENEYYQNIKITDIKDGEYRLFMDHYDTYEPFPLDEIKINSEDHYLELSQISYFEEEFPFIALSKNDETWMCITPNEINTMQKHINQATGNVLVFGLGLGYYPYMVSLKDDVKSVTIIEKDQKIIDIFKKYIYPQFKEKEKITIIHADALNFKSERQYQTTFVDLWHNPNDGLNLYIKFKQHEQNNFGKYQYWLDESMIAYFRRYLLLVIEEALNGAKQSDYLKAKSFEDRLVNAIYFATKNVTLNNLSDIRNFLSKINILNLVKTIKL